VRVFENVLTDRGSRYAVSGGPCERAEDARAMVAELVRRRKFAKASLAFGLLRAPATIWATLSAGGMRGLRLPTEPCRLTIAPDGDEPGRTAANALATRAHATGWRVSLLPAPDGRDWNDILAGKGEHA
jgi:hypothetical protein